MSKPGIFFSLDSVGDKQTLLAWAKTRGYTQLSQMVRVALYEYIRRRLPKNPVTVLHIKIMGIIKGDDR